MDDVVSTFPLLRLPNKAILLTLRLMTPTQKFGMSLLSKKNKSLVESLKLLTKELYVNVSSSLIIILFFQNNESICFELYRSQVNNPVQDLEKPRNIFILSENRGRWRTSLSVRQLLDHLKFIFKILVTTLQFSRNFGRFNLEIIHKNVKDFQRTYLTSGDHEYNKRILNVFKSALISLENLALVNGCVPRYILIQNFDFIHVTRVQTVQITLGELLLTNASGIDIFCRPLSAKMLNQFLKLWVKGSNPQLEIMLLEFNRAGFQDEELLRGLNYQNAPRNTERLFKAPGSKEMKKVAGGWDIWRLDGTKATVTVPRTYGSVNFKLFVWHDHCIVN